MHTECARCAHLLPKKKTIELSIKLSLFLFICDRRKVKLKIYSQNGMKSMLKGYHAILFKNIKKGTGH